MSRQGNLIRLRRRPRLRAVTHFGVQGRRMVFLWRYRGLAPCGSISSLTGDNGDPRFPSEGEYHPKLREPNKIKTAGKSLN